MEKIRQDLIETKRLVLRPYTKNDIADIFSYASNPDVTKYLLWEAHKTKADSQYFLDWIESVTCSEKGKVFFVYAIVLKDTERVIGSIDFKNTHKFAGQMDYVIGKEHWNNGYMTEAATALKNWAIETFPEIVRLQAFCQPENIGSRRVMEKLGMEYEGLRKKSMIVRGVPSDLIHFAFVRE